MAARTQTLEWLNARIDELEQRDAAKDAEIAELKRVIARESDLRGQNQSLLDEWIDSSGPRGHYVHWLETQLAKAGTALGQIKKGAPDPYAIACAALAPILIGAETRKETEQFACLFRETRYGEAGTELGPPIGSQSRYVVLSDPGESRNHFTGRMVDAGLTKREILRGMTVPKYSWPPSIDWEICPVVDRPKKEQR